MKIFVGQAVTGEDKEKISKESKEVCNIFGESAYCTVLEENEFEEKTNGDKMKHAFEKIDSSDAFLAIVRSEKRSEGMLMEIGYCLAKDKRIILAISKNVKNSYLKDVANDVIEFENHKDLIKKLENLK